jgi:hypothetical protein
LADAQTGAIGKEIARLQGVEIQKAQANRTFNVDSGPLNLRFLIRLRHPD